MCVYVCVCGDSEGCLGVSAPGRPLGTIREEKEIYFQFQVSTST